MRGYCGGIIAGLLRGVIAGLKWGGGGGGGGVIAGLYWKYDSY